MIKFWQRRFKSNVLTENLEFDDQLKHIKKELKESIHIKFAGSLAIRMVDSGSCNACEAECNALDNPYYDLHRLGIYFVASPRHADVILLSGVITLNMLSHAQDAYEQMGSPKWLITLGDCPVGDGVFKEHFAYKANAKEYFKVDFHIAGCPPNPENIIRGLLDFIKTI